MKRARHKRIVLRHIREHDELRAAYRAAVARQIRGALDYLAHLCDGVHVYAGFGRRDIDRRADKLGLIERVGDGRDQRLVLFCHALVYERSVSADEVDAERLCRAVERLRGFDAAVGRRRSADKRNRRDGDPFIDYRNAVFFFDSLADLDEMLGIFCDFVVYALAELILIVGRAVEKRYAHCDCADIEVFLAYHADCFKYVCGVEHGML